jgi:hypothetical protein
MTETCQSPEQKFGLLKFSNNFVMIFSEPPGYHESTSMCKTAVQGLEPSYKDDIIKKSYKVKLISEQKISQDDLQALVFF